MLGHLIYYRIKVLLKNRSLLFWTLIFPLIMGLFFKLVFSNLDQAEILPTKTPIAIVGDNQDSQNLNKILTQLKSHHQPWYQIKQLSPNQAQHRLTEGKIAGYYDTRTQPLQLFVARNNSTQSVLRSLLSQYQQNRALFTTLEKSQQVPRTQLMKLTKSLPNHHYTTNQSQNRNFSSLSFYFCTLIAMTIGYGFQFGLRNAQDEQANQSANGMRLSLTPISKLIIVLSNLIAAVVVFYTIVLVVVAVYRWGYQVDLGQHWPNILLVCFLGSILQICLGKFMGNILVKKSYSQKVGMGTLIIMLLSMLAGMMGTVEIKHWIDINLPIFGKLNVINLISDTLYQLFFYQNIQPIYANLLWLVGLCFFFLIVDFLLERRMQYASL
ncbi:ABC transporter permease [Bombilactobacillus bombi]|uniref:ABC transporter permease n=1 Tax=Bombilactobacillus bombi TaxID=1303590 RepID=UPI0015E5DAB8|nr:ABC transporter permease [Bombilactobacillus bombi]MBA1434737.1 ABC transporter permease [Bombilactobacillus bombi]